MSDERVTRQQGIDTWLAFLRAHARVTAALERELEEAEGLPVSWFDVLVQLRAAPGQQLRIQELGERLALTVSGLSRRISRMEQAGLVERLPCPEDRRGVLVTLTEAGERRYRRALPVHLRGVERLFLRHLSEQEADVLGAVFARVLAGLEEEAAGEATPSQQQLA
jgi:DNA-binding MarR family transcriptional regulator